MIRMKKAITIQMLMILALVGTICHASLYGQEKKLTRIKGQVINESNQALPGIVVKSFIGKDRAVTDKDGNFELSVAVTQTDRLAINESDYELSVIPIVHSEDLKEPIILKKSKLLHPDKNILLPFKSLTGLRNVAAINSISGQQLAAYPTASFLDALAGLLPGVQVITASSVPGEEEESTYVSVRGEAATIYVDGVIRNPYDLTPEEVDQVQVIKDLSGRAALGIYGSGPVLWITTKKGTSFNREISVSAEYGMSTPTVLPEYLDAFNYATLYNEALVNDGLSAYYSPAELEAYKNNSDPVNYPNNDYVGQYVRSSAPYRRANINFSGGDERVNYFSMISYVGSEGLESTGEQYSSDRFKLRGNVNINFNDYIKMNVNLSGTYRNGRSPRNDLFTLIYLLPSNAHTTSYDGKLIISDNFPINIENEMVHGGFFQTTALGTQNNVNLILDLNEFVDGLTLNGAVSFDGYSKQTNGKYLSAELYRLVKSSTGADSTELVQTEVVQDELSYYSSRSSMNRRTVASMSFNYDRSFGKHSLLANASYYQGMFERNATDNYQPDKMQDVSFRANYLYNDKYSAQLDLVFSGSMRMPQGKRFSAYPTLGLGWVVSNESFLKESSVVDYLKLQGSFGMMGTNNFVLTNYSSLLSGYNTFYLYETLWQQSGSWRTGALGTFADATAPFTILQQGSDSYVVPKKQILNIGLQGVLFGQSLSFEVNYYRNRDYDLISNLSSSTPSIFGSGQFLPAGNYGDIVQYGVDGLINYRRELGDFRVNIGANFLYARGRYVLVDEPAGLEDYRKATGKDIDSYLMYQADGLFQNQDEINAASARQIWGDLKPGDIRYIDYNNDQLIDEKDQYRSGDHAPRLYYGLNVSVGYKGFNLAVTGQGLADGKVSVLNSYLTTTGSGQNYSKQMLNRWPVTNDLPRLTTTSQNNIKSSSFWLVNGTSFRLKNIELSYTLPAALSQNFNVGNCKLFVRGTNLLSSSEMKKLGMDAESSSAGIMSYPLYSTVTFGITCKF